MTNESFEYLISLVEKSAIKHIEAYGLEMVSAFNGPRFIGLPSHNLWPASSRHQITIGATASLRNLYEENK